jgi:hypothetical protein
MGTQILRWPLKLTTPILLMFLGGSQPGWAQQASYAVVQPAVARLGEARPAVEVPAAPTPAPTAASFEEFAQPVVTNTSASSHFWDRENLILFSASAAFSTADFVVTRDNLRSGGRELNPVTRVFTGSTGALAVNFAGETAGVIGLSYFFHRTGHRRLERMVSMVNIGSSAAAVTYGMTHR